MSPSYILFVLPGDWKLVNLGDCGSVSISYDGRKVHLHVRGVFWSVKVQSMCCLDLHGLKQSIILHDQTTLKQIAHDTPYVLASAASFRDSIILAKICLNHAQRVNC